MTLIPTAASVASAFGVGDPIEPLAFVQHTVSRTWRLTTRDRPYLAKELWSGDDPEWTGQLADRMAFEQQITIALGERPAHRNRTSVATLDQRLATSIDQLLDRTARLTTLGKSLTIRGR